MEVRFFDSVDDHLLRFAVIIAKARGQWVFCKHKERDTYEIPGGHREAGEAIGDTAARELREETGAEEFDIRPVCAYSVTGKNRVSDGGETFGMLYYAHIERFGPLDSEMERVELFDCLPEKLTYPEIQPRLMEEFLRRCGK